MVVWGNKSIRWGILTTKPGKKLDVPVLNVDDPISHDMMQKNPETVLE